ncbi:MAG: GTPase ObgE [Psychroflexus sp.]|nr:GTPase ObgE [Psychroflexus sp.]MDR9448067.1 GTPase ObgE [Psychroflexus sp.]
MVEGNFVDYIRIFVRSGNGGKGSAHLRREKFVEKGGPDGGDGGRGGHVVIRGNKNFWTLFHLKFTQHIRAEHGENGGKQHSHGANGKDSIVEVPVGTVIKNADEEILTEITQDQQIFIVAEGGKGGLGNAHFKSATRQTPRYAQPGIKGIEDKIILELKILADVGLVGFPNAGKSTLLSVLTSAKPEIADYPFTTLKPNLGIVKYRDYQSFAIADIPGIIKGAAEGKGLGHRFLRHIERNALLLFLIPADSDDIVKEYQTLAKELAAYDESLTHKDVLIAISKCDLLDDELKKEIDQEVQKDFSPDSYMYISSATQSGLKELKDVLWTRLKK